MTEPLTPPEAQPHGRILLFTGGDPIASLVRWQTRSQYSHAALLIPGTNTVIESFPFVGVRKRELSSNDWTRIHAFAVPDMTAKQWQGSIQWAEAQLGSGYDWRNVLRFVSRLPGRDNQRWFCSELVHEAIAKTYRSLLQKPSCYVDPGELATSPLVARDEAFELFR